jgi:Enoyl-(Acyl carrier protein) reductase
MALPPLLGVYQLNDPCVEGCLDCVFSALLDHGAVYDIYLRLEPSFYILEHRSPLSERVAQSHPGCAEEYLQKLIEAHPLGRHGQPEDIAFVVLYLASGDSKFVTDAS